MMKKEDFKIVGLTVSCILINLIGKYFADQYELPLWLDSFGTVLAAYLQGPVSGAVVGLSGNLIYGVGSDALIYSVVNLVIGLIVGYFALKRWFDSLFGTMTVAMLVTLSSIALSVPLNLLKNNGLTGNLWGDGVIEYFQEQGVPAIPSYFLGEFYIDFADKIVTLVLLYALIQLSRKLLGGEEQGETVEKQMGEKSTGGRQAEKRSQKKAMLLLLIVLCTCVMNLRPHILQAAQTHVETEEGAAPNFNSYVRTTYSSDNGLPCGSANDIAQTNDGILWVGTYAGLYRYNGSEFRWMDDYDAVRNVNCLYVDEEGRLWIGTNDNGLAICINERQTNVVDQEMGLPSNSVRSIVCSSDGDYYVGTSGSMAVLTIKDGLKMLDEIPEVNYAMSSAADENGHVAAITAAGELCIIKEHKFLVSLHPQESSENYNCCRFDENGLLYVGSSQGRVYVYDISAGNPILQKTIACGSLSMLNALFFEDGRLYLCADNGIGYLEGLEDFHEIRTGEFNNSIDDMEVDYQGNYWFVSSRMGLLRLSESSFTNLYNTAGMESTVANSVARWQGILCFGTDTGLDQLDEEENKEIVSGWTELFRDVRIRCLMTDSKDRLWVCTYGKGLYVLAPEKNRAGGRSKVQNGNAVPVPGEDYIVYNSGSGQVGDRVRVACELSDGTILAASDAGLSFLKDDLVTKTIPYGDEWSSSMVMNLTELSDGRVLAGTDGDGIAVIRDGAVERMLTMEDGLPSGVVLRTVVDEEGVFIVTSNSLCYMDEEFQIRTIDHFPYYNNYDILEYGENTLFVLGSSGIYVVMRDELLADRENMKCDLLNSLSGLNSALTVNAWNLQDENNQLYLSCDDGVYRVDMEHYRTERRSYRMMISSICLDNIPYEVERGEAFEIGRDTDKVEIFPEVVNYSIEDPYVSYYLEGFDNEETILPQSELSSIVYTNLPKGSYIFHLSVLDKDKEKILEKSSYTLVKEKEIYDYRWFKAYIILVGVVAVAWFTWLIVRTQIQRTLNFQKKELEFARTQVKMGNETILAIARTVDAKDENTSQHSMRVSEYSVMIARELGLDETECENLRKAALLHDIGKISIPDRILNKPSRLTDEEYEVMKSHVDRGAEILKDFTLIDHVVEGAKYHHERYDGRGYSQGLKGEEIPLYGRIIGVADAFDAMTANRVYRKKLDFDYVLGELKKGRGTQFDPQMVDIMLRLIEEGKINVENLYSLTE